MDQKRQGILCIISAAFFFALMNLFVRLSGDLPLMQKCFFRNVVALLVSAGLLFRERGSISIPKGNGKYLMIRAVGGTIGLICNFYAIDHLNISDASMLNKLSPFFSIIFSVYVLQERANKKEWLAVLAAFAGALFVIKPTAGIVSFPAFVGLFGGLSAGFAYTYLRKLGMRGVKGSVIVFCFSAFSCVMTLPFLLVRYVPMSGKQWLFLLLAGCSAMGGQLSITAAYAKAPAKEISVFDYSQVIFAALLGMVFLGQLPDVLSVFGYVIIIGAAVYKWRSNAKKVNI